MKNKRGIIISVAITVLGVGTMAMSKYGHIYKTVGGGLFMVGLILFSLFLYNEIKK